MSIKRNKRPTKSKKAGRFLEVLSEELRVTKVGSGHKLRVSLLGVPMGVHGGKLHVIK